MKLGRKQIIKNQDPLSCDVTKHKDKSGEQRSLKQVLS